MSLTVREAKSHVDSVLGTSEWPWDPIAVHNRAGRHLAMMHGWRWLTGAAVEIDTVAGQNWVLAPGGMQRLISVAATNSLLNDWVVGTLAEILDYRTTEPGYSSISFLAASHVSPSTGGAPVARFELWPTPTETATNVGTAFIEMGWTDVEDDQTYFNLPEWLEGFYLEVVTTLVQGYTDRKVGQGITEGNLLSALRGSDQFVSAKRRDALEMPNSGVLRHGITQVPSRTYWDQFRARTVEAPS